MLWIKRHERPARPIKTQENGQISFCIISLRQGSNAAWTTKVGRVKAGLLTSPPSFRRLPGDDAYHRMFATSGMSAARCVIRELQQRVLFRILTWFPFDPSPFHAREPQHVQFIAAKIQQYFWDYNKKEKENNKQLMQSDTGHIGWQQDNCNNLNYKVGFQFPFIGDRGFYLSGRWCQRYWPHRHNSHHSCSHHYWPKYCQ